MYHFAGVCVIFSVCVSFNVYQYSGDNVFALAAI